MNKFNSLLPAEFENKYPDPGMFGTTPAFGFFLPHVRNFEISHVAMASATAEGRPAFYLMDVERADFFAITAPKDAFALHGVKDLRVKWGRAAADTTLATADNKTL